jgi:phage-related protein
MKTGPPKPTKAIHWIRSSKKDLGAFPDEVRNELGYDLWLVQTGGRPRSAKPLKGFGGADVLELIDDYDGDTYRAVYTVRFAKAVYVLHTFKKKSRHGIQTPHNELDVVRSRLRMAADDYAQRYSDEQ